MLSDTKVIRKVPRGFFETSPITRDGKIIKQLNSLSSACRKLFPVLGKSLRPYLVERRKK